TPTEISLYPDHSHAYFFSGWRNRKRLLRSYERAAAQSLEVKILAVAFGALLNRRFTGWSHSSHSLGNHVVHRRPTHDHVNAPTFAGNGSRRCFVVFKGSLERG